ALVPAATLTLPAQQAAPTGALTPAQLRTLEAFIDRLIPRDQNGPGAVDAGAQNYIDRQLAGYLSSEKNTFLAGLEAVDAYARRTHGASLADLPAEQRDQVLTAIDTNQAEGLPGGRAFFNRARRLTLEGMFGDPYYGGNKNFAGWDLIQYPGPRPATGPEHQKMATPATPYRRSAFGPDSGHDH
ncbi:MAG TPA: gluconate 2-dehydrogenase subunit 3 family protein, partial [Bryobacteraceae bacterium]